MAGISNATHTHKTILLALAEGWRLCCRDSRGWSLLQPDRQRPFAYVDQDSVQVMTTKGWLTEGFMNNQGEQSFEKILTPLGRRCARHLIDTGWAKQGTDPIVGKIGPSRGPSGLEAWGISA
jgi:hypothetical protein